MRVRSGFSCRHPARGAQQQDTSSPAVARGLSTCWHCGMLTSSLYTECWHSGHSVNTDCDLSKSANSCHKWKWFHNSNYPYNILSMLMLTEQAGHSFLRFIIIDHNFFRYVSSCLFFRASRLWMVLDIYLLRGRMHKDIHHKSYRLYWLLFFIFNKCLFDFYRWGLG